MYQRECDSRSELLADRPDDMCKVEHDEGWICHRPKGHDGVHLAGTGGKSHCFEWGVGDCYEEFGRNGVEMHEETPPPGSNPGRCSNHGPRGSYFCTRVKGHDGLCMAGRADGTMIAQWWAGTDEDHLIEDDDEDDYEPDEEEWAAIEETQYLYELLNP